MQGYKKDMSFVLDMQATFVTVPIVDCQHPVSTLRVWARKQTEQCYEAHAYSTPAVGI